MRGYRAGANDLVLGDGNGCREREEQLPKGPTGQIEGEPSVHPKEVQDSEAWAVVSLQKAQVMVRLQSQMPERWKDLVDDIFDILGVSRTEAVANFRLLQPLAVSHAGFGE
ncbi:hypothetical protein LOK49_LG12G00613 [Camellia lanceoleosa]|uniref:Uncharacterized protein n=1 Tax=Camellia lanceoleosa TaxID=1840588 RepID=A0ACC0FWI0_9ERIC|nr:hypothetical protein LOK49_LG12G00613 [Camellia lanceoleosa]